jgi:hypothetical protein
MKNEVSSVEIKQVAEYEEALKQLERYKKKHADVFHNYSEMAEEVNQKRQIADKTVRGRGVSCGPWELYSQSVDYDPVKLYEMMGREDFLKVGGQLKVITQYDLDKSKVSAAISQQVIPKKVAEQITTKTLRYHAPKEIKA